jgi:hypothetical protein
VLGLNPEAARIAPEDSDQQKILLLLFILGLESSISIYPHKSANSPNITRLWSEPLRVDKKLSNANSWRKTYEEDEAAL